MLVIFAPAIELNAQPTMVVIDGHSNGVKQLDTTRLSTCLFDGTVIFTKRDSFVVSDFQATIRPDFNAFGIRASSSSIIKTKRS